MGKLLHVNNSMLILDRDLFPLSLSTISRNHLQFNSMLKILSTIWRNHLQ